MRPPSGSGGVSAHAGGLGPRASAAGRGKGSTLVAALVDTNVLVYRFDPRFPRKQAIATETLRRGLAVEDARREAEEILNQFVVVYPTEALVRTAIRGWATYQLDWFDAHLWAYAHEYGLTEILSEDFQHDRLYGGVRALNPFI